jgi:hypothetical protein
MDAKQQAIIDRILKLMELAKDENGGFTAEKESAQKMAAKLMEQYSLDVADLRNGKMKDGYFHKFDMDMGKEKVDWERRLASAIGKAFDVTVVNRDHPTWTLMYCGGKTDIDISIFFFKFLRRTISVQSERSFKKATDRRTFAFGMVEEIGRRMLELYEKRQEFATSDSRAVMVVKQDGLDKFVKEQFPNMTYAKTAPLRGSHEAYAAGKVSGSKVNISRPIGTSGRSTGAIA